VKRIAFAGMTEDLKMRIQKAKKYFSVLWLLFRNCHFPEFFFVLQELLPRFFFRFDLFFVASLPVSDVDSIDASDCCDDVSLDRVSASFINEVCSSLPLDSSVMKFHFGKDLSNTWCMTIRDEGKISACAFFRETSEMHSPSGFSRALASGVCFWVFGVFVDEKFRGRGYFSKMQNKILSVARLNGVKRICCELHFFNQASVRAHRAFGYSLVSKVLCLRVLNRLFFLPLSGRKLFGPVSPPTLIS
jgi:GNAT superfamily N-acetyltransferase